MTTDDRDTSKRGQDELGSDRTRTPPVSNEPAHDAAPPARRASAENEGEGSRTADRRYRDGVQDTLRKGSVEDDAERARRDVEASPDEYRRAEEEGRRHSAGEAPGDTDDG